MSPSRDNGTREIFVVEDNPGDVALIREALKKTGPLEVTVAVDGEQAITLLGQRRFSPVARLPNLILMDLHLPRMDGYAVLAALRREPALRWVPVIMFSTSDTDRDIARCYQLGASCYVPKPFDLSRFNEVVQAIVHFWTRIAHVPKSLGGDF